MITLDYISLGIGIGGGIVISLFLFLISRRKKPKLESLFELLESLNGNLLSAQKENVEAHKKMNILYEMFKEFKK